MISMDEDGESQHIKGNYKKGTKWKFWNGKAYYLKWKTHQTSLITNKRWQKKGLVKLKTEPQNLSILEKGLYNLLEQYQAE